MGGGAVRGDAGAGIRLEKGPGASLRWRIDSGRRSIGQVHPPHVLPCRPGPHRHPCGPALGRQRRAAGGFTLAAGVLAGRYLAWLRHLNARDYDIYLCVNPIRPGSRGREKEPTSPRSGGCSSTSTRTAPPDTPASSRTWSGALFPAPPTFSEARRTATSSSGTRFPTGGATGQAEAVMRGLAERYGGDRAATDVARVMRLPGFRNCKPGRARSLVTWTWYGGRLVRPRGFRWAGPARAGAGQPHRGPAEDPAGAPLPERAGLGCGGRCAAQGGAARDGHLTARATEAGQAESRLLRPPDRPAQGGRTQKGLSG